MLAFLPAIFLFAASSLDSTSPTVDTPDPSVGTTMTSSRAAAPGELERGSICPFSASTGP